MEVGMWTGEHRRRHGARPKEMVPHCAEAEVARWLERAEPPRSARATPVPAVARAIAWHRRVGGRWRALPPDLPPWRTVDGRFRRGLDLGLFDRMRRDVAYLRRRPAGRRRPPRLGIIDTRTVKCIPVRGPRGGACPRAGGAGPVGRCQEDGRAQTGGTGRC